MEPTARQLRILHFNDESPTTPFAGAARFASKIRALQAAGDPALVLFSGDVFNPSLLSTVTRGKHMSEVLNMIGVHAACHGNHDYDFGVESLRARSSECNFPWLLSNVVDAATGQPLADGKRSLVLEFQGWRVGLMGLIEIEWLDTLSTISPGDVRYTDFVEVGRDLALHLRQEERCDLVIALTHMRAPNDERLARSVAEIDVVLGGHDHDYWTKVLSGGALVVKSGSDFRDLSELIVTPCMRDGTPHHYNSGPLHHNVAANGIRFRITVEHHEVRDEDPQLPEMQVVVARWMERMGADMDKVLGTLPVPLDCYFASVRTKETNAGNLLADICRESAKADLAIINSGTIRADRILGPGPFTMRNMLAMLPLDDAIMLLEMKGSDVMEALENGVSKYPAMEGRFPCVSGIAFEFMPSQKPGSRIVRSSVMVCGRPIEVDAWYKVATKEYLYLGKDGYEVFSRARVLVDAERGARVRTVLRNIFLQIRVLNNIRSVQEAGVSRAMEVFMRHSKSRTKRHMRRLSFVKRSGGKLASAPEPLTHEQVATKTFFLEPVLEGRIAVREDISAIESGLVPGENPEYLIARPEEQVDGGGSSAFLEGTPGAALVQQRVAFVRTTTVLLALFAAVVGVLAHHRRK